MIDYTYLNIGIFRFQILSYSRDSPSTAYSHHKNVNLSICILPYLRASGFKMHLFVQFVKKSTIKDKQKMWFTNNA